MEEFEEDTATDGEFLDFKSNGQVAIYSDQEHYSTAWELRNNNKILYLAPGEDFAMPENGFTINTLNGSSLILHAIDSTSSGTGDIHEETWYLKR